MPENAKIQVHLDLDSSIEAYEKLKLKFLEMAEKAKETGQVIDAMTGGIWTPVPHPIEKITDYLAQAAARILGEGNVFKEWDYDYSTCLYIMCIEVRISKKMCRFMMKFTEEFFESGDLKDKFFDMLWKMCGTFDTQMPMVYALMPKRGVRNLAKEDGDIPMTVMFAHTTNSYQYLKHGGYVEQLDWYWDNPNVPFPQRLAYQGNFYAEKEFWYKNIQKGSTIQKWKSDDFAKGGFISGNSFNDMSDSGALMHSICPGLTESVPLPCGCLNDLKTERLVQTVQAAIIHLNDKDTHNGIEKEWTREEIADWLESLDVDLTLKDNNPNH